VDTTAANKRTSSSSASSSSPSHQLFTSSSCISLYETIDEVELPSLGFDPDHAAADLTNHRQQQQPPPLPPSNPKFQSNYSKFRSNSNHSHSSRQLRLSSMQQIVDNSDWKRNRRSSAIIFGSDFHDLIDDDVDEMEQDSKQQQPQTGSAVNGHQNGWHSGSQQNRSFLHRGQLNGTTNGHSHHHLLHQLNRSSDDLLLMSNRSFQHYQHAQQQHQDVLSTDSALVRPVINGATNNGRIYENLLNSGSAGGGYHHSHPSHHHNHNRKLTKDSGYESASTLVSLTQLNITQMQQQQQSSPTTPLPPAMVPTMGHHNHQMISQMVMQQPHSRTHSIDSTNSLCGEMQSPSPPIPKW